MSANSTLSPTVISLPSSDHFPIICSLKITSYTAPITNYLTRAIRAINITGFCHDIVSSRLITRLLLVSSLDFFSSHHSFSSRLITHPPSTLAHLVDYYNSTFFSTNRHLSSLKSSSLNLNLGLLRH